MMKIKIIETVQLVGIRIKKFLNRPALVILLAILFCVGFGNSLFYKYVFIPIENDFFHQETIVDIDIDSYFSVLEKWEENRERFENADDKEFKDPFFPVRIEPGEEKSIEEEITPETLEEILAQTLFDFYEMRGEGMPPISERALIWEELGLGTAEDYRGIYTQNVSLLGILKEMMIGLTE